MLDKWPPHGLVWPLPKKTWKYTKSKSNNPRNYTISIKTSLLDSAFTTTSQRRLAAFIGRLYTMALDMAKKAELAWNYERDQENKIFIQNDNWNSARTGLLAGESLLLQLQQMEMAYLETNTRTLEITQSFSMLQLAPEYLLKLRNGEVLGASDVFTVPRWAFDLFYRRLYRRKIKSVRITIPCVVGPYVPVPAILTLLEGDLIMNLNEAPTSGVSYALNTVVASTANNDGGQFELNFRDERYLPFEGGGAIDSKWRLELPTDYQAFDYETISDVIIHISYTAKRDGTQERAPPINLKRLISLKQEFPDLLYKLNQEGSCELNLELKHFPYFAAQRGVTIADQDVEILEPAAPGGMDITAKGIAGGSFVKTLEIAGFDDETEVADVLFIVDYTIN